MKNCHAVALLLAITLLFCACSPRSFEQVDINKPENNEDTPVFSISQTEKAPIETMGLTVNFVADKQDLKFYKMQAKSMNSVYVAGVNMGLSVATTDLADPDVDFDTYTKWFEQISEMNANTVRVFTKMPPQFYSALLQYNNNNASNPLYLMQGIWFDEDLMYSPGDCFDEKSLVQNDFEKSITETLDVVHGNANIKYGAKKQVFGADVSKWLIGYILGLEWSNDFLNNSNSHKDKTSFEGKYLNTRNDASPFEVFLCEEGNKLIEYETDKYKTQTPVAFLNWTTDDTLTHDNEPDSFEDSCTVNTETILTKPSYVAGLFAAVDVYPYYPKSIDYQDEYSSYKDNLTGRQNNYKAYLQDLKKEYSVPIIVAEFGVPTSRGMAAESVLGYNQGKLTEQQQGRYVSNMIVDIASSDYAGGLIFSWQDEWFKQTWNTYKYYPSSAKKRTPNKMSAEQNYGIVAMEAGKTDICYVDGKADEWVEKNIVSENDNITLSAKYDEAYLYLYVKLNSGSFDNSKIVLPISTVGIGSDEYKVENKKFSKSADFVVVVDGKDNSAIYCDSYYDYFSCKYRDWLSDAGISLPFAQKQSGSYNLVKQYVSSQLYLPKSAKTLDPVINDAGKLTYGISDPNSEMFNSLSDFYADGNTVEIRIAWDLLNVVNIAEGRAIGNFNSSNSDDTVKFSEIYVGADISNSNKAIELKPIKWMPLAESSYHTRLKSSYPIIQQTLKDLFQK